VRGGAGRGILRRVVLSLVAVALALGGVRALARSRTFQLFGRLVPRVETSEKAVALTFDDGPTAEHVGEILSVLEAEAAHATFFVNGANLAEDPEPARRLVAGGHELGNHTFSHARMILKAQATYATEVTRTDDLIRRAGHQGEIFFRAPFTWKLVGLPFFLARTGRTTITFDVEPESYPETARSATAIEAHVLGRVRPGSIVLLHVWYSGNGPSRAALPGILSGLRSEGYRLLTLSELLRLGDAPRRRT
jgi:peptidoglycan/xylan/chitin deacetylase (PgdA/CDA1 family)